MHRREDAEVVGHGGEHEVAVFEDIRDQVAHMGAADIVEPGVGDAPVRMQVPPFLINNYRNPARILSIYASILSCGQSIVLI